MPILPEHFIEIPLDDTLLQLVNLTQISECQGLTQNVEATVCVSGPFLVTISDVDHIIDLYLLFELYGHSL